MCAACGFNREATSGSSVPVNQLMAGEESRSLFCSVCLCLGKERNYVNLTNLTRFVRLLSSLLPHGNVKIGSCANYGIVVKKNGYKKDDLSEMLTGINLKSQ